MVGAAWVGQDHARPPPAHDPPSANPARSARHHQDPFGRRRPVPRPSPSRPLGPSALRTTRSRTRASSAAARIPAPGEVSLSHHGVLFLDELPRVPPQRRRGPAPAARRPRRHHHAGADRHRLSSGLYPRRSDESLPLRLSFGRRRTCTCSPAAIRRYRARVSGPLLDRIDIHIEVPALAYDDLANKQSGEDSAQIRSASTPLASGNSTALPASYSATPR